MTRTATTLIAAALAAALISVPATDARAGACARMGLQAQVVTHGDMQAPYIGAKVKLAWVDQFGRVSAMSIEVAVTDNSSTSGITP